MLSLHICTPYDTNRLNDLGFLPRSVRIEVNENRVILHVQDILNQLTISTSLRTTSIHIECKRVLNMRLSYKPSPSTNPSPSIDLLSLVRNFDKLLAKRHTRSILLGRDSTRLGLVLDKCDALAAGDQTDFAEALEAAEDACERFDVVVVVRQVLHE